MKRLLLTVVLITSFLLIRPVSAQITFDTNTAEAQPTAIPSSGPRYAACDQCGYCPPNSPPSSWASCQKCLYPNISSDPTTQESLKIDPETNLAVTPAVGHQFTFLGCLSTGAGSFSQQGGAGSVVQVLLKTVFSIVGGIAFLYFLYGAFVLATSQNDPEKLNYGKRLIYGAIVGLIFSLTSVLLINFLASKILRIPGFGS